MRANDSGSRDRNSSSVSSENTTPKPKVSSARFCSCTATCQLGCAFLVSSAKYRPPGPPPTTVIRILSVSQRRPEVAIPAPGQELRPNCFRLKAFSGSPTAMRSSLGRRPGGFAGMPELAQIGPQHREDAPDEGLDRLSLLPRLPGLGADTQPADGDHGQQADAQRVGA